MRSRAWPSSGLAQAFQVAIDLGQIEAGPERPALSGSDDGRHPVLNTAEETKILAHSFNQGGVDARETCQVGFQQRVVGHGVDRSRRAVGHAVDRFDRLRTEGVLAAAGLPQPEFQVGGGVSGGERGQADAHRHALLQRWVELEILLDLGQAKEHEGQQLPLRHLEIQQPAELLHQLARLQHLRFVDQHDSFAALFVDLQQTLVELRQKSQLLLRGLGAGPAGRTSRPQSRRDNRSAASGPDT